MSLGAELLMRDIADRLTGTVLLSDFGDGCPLLDEGDSPPVRLARRPIGGLVRRHGIAVYAPPLSLDGRWGDAARLAKSFSLIADTLSADAASLITTAHALTPDGLAVLRVRGDRFEDHSLDLIYEDPVGGDHVYLRGDLATDDLLDRASALKSARVDEFDEMTSAFGQGGVITTLRHGASLSEAILNPASTLDQPDDQQVAAALGEGRVVMAADGGCALFISQLSGAPMPVSISIANLEDGAPDPMISLPNAPDWTIRTARSSADWWAIASPEQDAAPLISTFVEISAKDSPRAEITEVTAAITRKRGGWEIWDEAQQQLELEESW